MPDSSRPVNRHEYHRCLAAVLALALLLPAVACPFAEAAVGDATANDSQDTAEPLSKLLLPLTPKLDETVSGDPAKPSGTLMIPLSPAIGDQPAMPRAKRRKRPLPQAAALPSGVEILPPTAPQMVPSGGPGLATPGLATPGPATPGPAPQVLPGAGNGSAGNTGAGATAQEQGTDIEAGAIAEEAGEEAVMDEDTLLKGTVQIVADDTEYDQEKNTFLGSGNAVAIIAGQDSRLEADTILYDQNTQTIDARGNVKIVRAGQLTTGSSFKFKVNSDEYLLTDPDTELQGTSVVARVAQGNRNGLVFQKGTIKMPQPFHFSNNQGYGPLSQIEDSLEKSLHPEAYMPNKPTLRIKARKMTYERYKEQGNLTIHGGRAMIGRFGIPFRTITTTVAGDQGRVVMPITPTLGNNFMVGGVNIGPQFSYAVGKTGVFSWAPLIQFGGRTINPSFVDENANKNKVGAGFRISYRNSRISSRICYGSVSNILVADFQAKLTRNTIFQSGVNRFLNDGLFGLRRPRLIAEIVDQRFVTKIPFISALGFRTSAGWAQDQPQLLNLTPEFAKLFEGVNQTQKKSAFRLQEQITATTHPVFSLGNEKWGAQSYLFGGIAGKAYSTGDSLLMAQVGPILKVKLNRVSVQSGYTQSMVRGKSPFVFDQFVQGQRSAFIGGDLKLCKYLTVGGYLGRNLNLKQNYARTITAAFGPEDFKVLLSRDTIRGINRYGFDLLFGSPIPYDKLVLKGHPDAGQTGSGI